MNASFSLFGTYRMHLIYSFMLSIVLVLHSTTIAIAMLSWRRNRNFIACQLGFLFRPTDRLTDRECCLPALLIMLPVTSTVSTQTYTATFSRACRRHTESRPCLPSISCKHAKQPRQKPEAGILLLRFSVVVLDVQSLCVRERQSKVHCALRDGKLHPM
jgi:hypothetical protein